MDEVTVIINNCNLLSWPKQMCQDLQRMQGLKEIIIVDNGSSSRSLLQWYKDCPHQVVFLENIGHKAPWLSGVTDRIATDLYVVTDPDLDLSQLPNDTLQHLARILKANPTVGKVGLSLQTTDIPPESKYHDHVQRYEAALQSLPAVDNLYVPAPVDTTFAIYDRRVLNEYKICGVRTLAPYTAKHIPWHITTPDAEFEYYLNHANAESSSYVKFTGYTEANPLRKLYDQRTHGKVSTKWDSYFDVYDKWLHPYRNQPIKMMEIGVQNGGSLEVWTEYFKKAELFIGCDINPRIQNLKYNDPRIQIVLGAASEQSTRNTILGKNSTGFDIIIDDGSHRSIDTISNFINYFPLLKPGGVFIVEDMHCAYWEEYEGGYFNHRSAASFFKHLFDLVNIEHARGDFTAKQLFQTFFGHMPLPEFLQDNSIYSVSAYNSIYVIEKSTQSRKPLLGSCVIVGDEAIVDDRVLAHRTTLNAQGTT